jgi:hypothetical protein
MTSKQSSTTANPQKHSLDTAITTALSSPAAKRLLELLWGDRPPELAPASYLEYYAQQGDSFYLEQSQNTPGAGMAGGEVKTHQQLADIATRLVVGSQTKENVIMELCDAQTTSSASAAVNNVESSVDWAARVLTCTEIGVLRCAFSSRRPLRWESGTLRDFLADVFSPSKQGNVQVRLEKNFNALNLERLAGITVEWTTDLSSHLSLRDGDTKVLVFHQATFLENMKQ